MAPTRSKKLRKSTESTSSSVETHNLPARPQMVPTKTHSPVRTPIHRSPAKRARAGITMGQKQALIDNLQLEITERARKLRAQYMLQSQGLRTRIEIRVNRIPMALRKAKMGDLMQKYSETGTKNVQRSPKRIEKAASPVKNRMDDIREPLRASPSPQKPKKRTSDEITPADKENEDIENPKKRLRGAPGPANRIVSRGKVAPSQVLSPRSANSRTLIRSPIRPAPPAKSALARPVSPLKPIAPTPAGGAAGILTNMVEKAKATRGAAGRKATEPKPTTANTRAGRGRGTAAPAPAPTRAARGRASAVSDSSDSSSTTVVRKTVLPKKEPLKRTVMGTLRGMGAGASKKAPSAAKPVAPATAGRVLRKRN